MTILTAIDSAKSGANPPAEDRADRAAHRVNLRCLDHSATIDFRGGPAAEWLLRAGPIAKQLNEEATDDARL